MCVYRLGSVTASRRPVGCSQLMGSLLSSLILFFWRGQWRCVSNLQSNTAFLDKCILHGASPLVCVGVVVWCRANHALDSEGLSEELLYGSQEDARKEGQMGARLARTGVCVCVCARALYVCLCTCSSYTSTSTCAQQHVLCLSLQMLITASQIQWTTDVTRALMTSKERADKSALKSLKKKQVRGAE